MAHESYMKTVLETTLAICAEMGGQAITDQISIRLGARDRLAHKRMLNTLSDLRQQGRLSRIRQGVYGPPRGVPHDLNRAEVMWRLLRMRKRVQVDDLVEMAGVSEKYALEWLRMLVKRGVVVKHQQPGGKGTWQLVSDQIESPVNTEKAEALRDLRRKRKNNALKMLEDAKRALGLATQAVEELE